MVTDNNNNKYSVAVVIPAYNAEPFVGRAIDSVLAQSCPADEIIVVDDGSRDNTAAVVKRYGGKVHYIQQENAGVSAARNCGIRAAHSQWVAFLDADDVWLPDKLKLQTELLKRNPQLVWACANFLQHYDGNGSQKEDAALPQEKAEEILAGKDYFADYLQVFTQGFYAWTGTVIIKRSVFDAVGYFNTGQAHGEEDTDMWFRIAFKYPHIGYISQPLSIYYVDIADSLSDKSRPLEVISYRLARLLELAQQAGKLEEFKGCAAVLLKEGSLPALMAQKRYGDILALVEQFGYLLNSRYCREMRFRARWPWLSPLVDKLYFRFKGLFL